MKKLRAFAVVCSLFALALQVNAQNKEVNKTVKDLPTKEVDSPAIKKKAALKLGLIYNSNSVYQGRTDSVTIPNYSIGATYTLKSGIFFSGSINYVPNREFDKLDGGSLQTGYNFESGNLSGGVALSKYFASFNSTSIISALDLNAGAELSYNISDIITPSVHVDYAIGNGGPNDFILTGGITHGFDFDKPFSENDKLSIEPGIHFNAGTQNFYNTYFVRRKNSEAKRQNFRKTGKKNGATTAVTNTATSSTANYNEFQVLAYEFNVPFTYTIKKVAVEVNPVYAIAVHKIDDDGTKTSYVPNTSVFYLQLGLSYNF
jgi:hypothetical protein